MLIHGFLKDTTFLNKTTIVTPVNKTGGICILSQPSLSYFVTPQEFVDERTARANNLNTAMTGKASFIVDQSEFAQFITDIEITWSTTEQANFFAIIDYLCFSYNVNATPTQIQTALAAWPQYLVNTYVYSNTTTQATVYNPNATTITCPDYVSFTFVIGNGTQYQMRVWLNNAIFYQSYPLSTIRDVVPPLPLSTLYTVSIVSGVANVLNTALIASETSQQALQSYIQSGEYTGYIAQDIQLVDTNNNYATAQFNILYNGAVPTTFAIRTAIRNFILTSGVGTQSGWTARAPSLFVTELWYLLPMWENTTSLINATIYPNVVQLQKMMTDATTVLHDITSGFITANISTLSVFYKSLTVIGVPDTENLSSRLSLAAEHPTYQDVATTDPAFNTMTTITQQFATLLGGALSIASGNTSTNQAFSTYTAPGDNRTYITFTVSDVEYYVITQTSYLALVG